MAARTFGHLEKAISMNQFREAFQARLLGGGHMLIVALTQQNLLELALPISATRDPSHRTGKGAAAAWLGSIVREAVSEVGVIECAYDLPLMTAGEMDSIAATEF